MAQTVKKLPAMRETQVRSLGQEDLPGEGNATHSSILAKRIPRRKEPDGLQSMGVPKEFIKGSSDYNFSYYLRVQ